jgi:hypothetical protein
MTFDEAGAVAVAWLRNERGAEAVALADIVPDVSRSFEDELGWVVAYDTRAFVESRDPLEGLMAAAPLLVMADGRVVALGTSEPAEHYLDLIRRSGPQDEGS